MRLNGFGCPGTRPWFDQTHPCANKTVVSATAFNNNFTNWVTGHPGTSANFPLGTRRVIGRLGAVGHFDNTTGTQQINFTSGLPAQTGTFPQTLAGIFQLNALHNNSQCIIETGSSVNTQLEVLANVLQLNRWNGLNDSTGYTVAALVPYFFACSTDNSTITNFVWTRLDSGSLQYKTMTPGGAVVSGTLRVSIGNAAGASNAFDGWIAAAMYSQYCNSLGDMLKWAADPWAFWYPKGRFDLGAVIAAGGTPFVQTDWPIPSPIPQIDRIWVWSQTRMQGQDRLPNRQQHWPLSEPIPQIDRTWLWRQTNMFGQDRLPNRQQDWPNPPPVPYPDETWTWRQTGMRGQDKLPFRQQDWPNPVPIPQIDPTWLRRQTGMLFQDTLPFRQQDWPNPVPISQIDETWLQGFLITLRSITVVLPHNQYDWPIPLPIPQIDPTWTWRQTRMQGQDKLPFRQQDWPNPVPIPQIDPTWLYRQLGMLGQDRFPFRQQDWPNPAPIPQIDPTWTQGFNLFRQPVTPVVIVSVAEPTPFGAFRTFGRFGSS